MGKNYVENSLKKFLKRKVKITLGFVVAFMISGTLGFAVENSGDTVKEDLKNQNEIYEIVEENLTGLGAKIFADKSEVETDSGLSIKVTDSKNNEKTIKITRKDGITTIDATAINSNAKISFDDKLVSEKVKTNIENALTGTEEGQRKYQYFTKDTPADEKKIGVNNGIIIQKDDTYSAQSTGQKADGTKIDEVTNNGILFGIQGAHFNDSKAVNNGIIYLSFNGSDKTIAAQQSAKYKNTEIYNNGLIISNSSGQNTQAEKAKLFNKGVMLVERFGQILGNSYSNAYNYGILEAKWEGQRTVTVGGNSVIENYGTINITAGKYKESSNSKDIVTSGQNVNMATDKAYNYGLIKVTDGYAMNGKGEKYNYGVIKASGDSAIFGGNGKNTSKGIIIGGNETSLKDYMDTNAVFDSNYNLLNKDAEIISGELSGSDLEKNVAVIQNESAELSGIFDNKTIASVVTTDMKEPVFTLGKEETVLKDTNLVGYFENTSGGTLLTVDANETLTLDGKTNITAVKDQQSETGDVYALELKDGSTLNLIGSDVKVNGIINGYADTKINAYAAKGDLSVDTNGKLFVGNLQGEIESDYLKSQNYTDVTLSKENIKDQKIKDLEFNFSNTVRDENGDSKENKVVIRDGIFIAENGNFEDKTTEGNKVNIIIENLETFAQNLGEIKLGEGENTLQINNNLEKAYDKQINLGAGDKDRFIVIGDTKTTDTEGNPIVNTFNYHVWNAETVELQGGIWGNWDNANGTIGFDDSAKANNNLPNTVLGDDTTLKITLNTENKGSDFANYINDKLEGNHVTISGTGNGSAVKYWIGDKGIDSSKFTSSEYSIDKDKVEIHSPIFNVESNDKGTSLTLKTAEEIGAEGQHRIIYDAYINQIKSDVANKNVITKINGFDTSKEFLDYIHSVHATGIAYYTAGSVVTKDITDTYLSSVEDFRKRAGKGEWLAQGKYINSDTEFDGGSKVKGYDGDVTGTMGMIEYGVSDSTAYGVAFGKGESEMDIDGGGKLDGDNTYIGAYMKHRTQNGIELVGNIGYMKNDMDSSLRSDFNAPLVSDSTYEEGTANSSAVILSLKGRKDYKISDDLRLQPTLAGRIFMINQEEAENQEMGFTVSQQDIIVLEATAGMGIAKDFTLSHGIFEINGGVEYTFATSNTNNNAEYTLFGEQIKMEDVDMAENRGTIYFGADYEHENGVGFNGKYEMMWSDKGDDSRITAGVSYRF